ncbi:MAG TPA: carboxypeptidase-like regulatory domain-containing protein [Solirubrobacterales bacterium]|nr:carboxypeptidase-like regulatory domain-containing protein [Solirubrobacterales bacterium]
MRRGFTAMLALAALLCLAFPAAAAAGSISGNVTDAVGGGGLEEIEVCAWWIFEEGEEGEEEDWGCTLTETGGSYEIPDLEPHAYLVEFWDPAAEYAIQFYDHRTFYWESDPVTVGAGATTEVDAELERGGTIQGTVRDAATGAALEEVEVCAWELETEGGRCTLTDPAGNYTLRRFVSGDYKVEFWPYFEPFEPQFWNHKPSWSEADVLGLGSGQTASGINADLLGNVLPPPAVVVPPTVTPPAVVQKPKPKPCRKGLRKKKVKGKVRCVKVRKHRKHKKHRKHRGQKSRAGAAALRLAR